MKEISHSVTILPEGYREFYQVDLQKNKKMSILVNGIALLLSLVMVVLMHLAVPITTLFSMEEGMANYLLRFAVVLVASVAYLILHELTHAAVMRFYGAKKICFGFTGLYAFAGSKCDYFDKFAYIQVALAPVVVWGILLTIINLLVPTSWVWVVYLVQITNVSGAAGDLFVSIRFGSMPSDILVRDTGVSMTVYSAK